MSQTKRHGRGGKSESVSEKTATNSESDSDKEVQSESRQFVTEGAEEEQLFDTVHRNLLRFDLALSSSEMRLDQYLD
jgi:hypothetical protein